MRWERRLKNDHEFTPISHGDLLEKFEQGTPCPDSDVFKRFNHEDEWKKGNKKSDEKYDYTF